MKTLIGILAIASCLCWEAAMGFQLTSPAFQAGQMIPKQYTCDGDDKSPPLYWQDAPKGTKSFVLIMDDPDAPGGTWVHWVVVNLPSDFDEMAENLAPLPQGAESGKNSWQRLGYGGPCPPSGTHRYYFKLYALDTVLKVKEAVKKTALEDMMKGHILGQTQLMGRYSRSR